MGDVVKDKNEIAQSETLTPSLRLKRSPALRQIMLGIVIFLCGIIVGTGVTLLIARRIVIKALRNPEGMPQRITTRMKKNLSLSDVQAEKVQQIISRHLGELNRIRKETHPRVRENLGRLKEEVADVLDEEQERKWRERFEKLESLFPPDPSSSEKD
ncbi:hypothetical protein JW926_08485 [Candidatus Sumerlaeota bacterium]|nr:hypothetical protein [Candidatus Sumerlaeota bacterium]